MKRGLRKSLNFEKEIMIKILRIAAQRNKYFMDKVIWRNNSF